MYICMCIYIYICDIYTYINKFCPCCAQILLELVVVKLVDVLVCEVVIEEEEVVLVTVPDVRVLEDVVPGLFLESRTIVALSSLLKRFYWK